MIISSVMYPVETLYSITTTYVSKEQKRYPKLLKFFDAPKKQEYIRFSEFEERMEMDNDSTSKIKEGDHHYFPPSFHRIPVEKCKSKTMEHSSPWNDNFGKRGNKHVNKQAAQEGTERRKKKKASKTKREMFMDVHMGILRCVVPSIGYLYDLEKEKKNRKRGKK